jgi:hypothetical protein
MKRIVVTSVILISIIGSIPNVANAQSNFPLTLTTLSPYNVVLQWNGTASDGWRYYILRKAPSSGACSSNVTDYTSIAFMNYEPGAASYMDYGLEPLTQYCYMVMMLNTGYYPSVLFGPAIATTFSLTPTATPTLMPTLTPTPTQTPTPTGTITTTSTPVPYIPATIAPPTLQSVGNQCIVPDYHFTMMRDSPWNTSPGATWSYSKYTLSQTESINQIIGFPATGEYMASIRASSPVTPAQFSLSIGSETYNISTTKTIMTAYPVTFTIQNTDSVIIRITAPSNTNLVVDRICIVSTEMAQAQGFGSFTDPAGNLGLVDFVGWFTPLELRSMFANPFQWNWDEAMGLVAQIATTLMIIAMPNILQYYFAGRVAMLAMAWFFGFVMKRIGHPVKGGETQVVVLGRGTGVYVPKHLPSLGPRVLRGGRSRRL